MRVSMRDLRYTIRMWGRNPCFTAVTILVLALGIAANTAVFSVVSAILLRPLPGIADPGRLVSLFRIQNGNTFDDMGYPDYRDYRDRNHSLLGLAAHGATALKLQLRRHTGAHGLRMKSRATTSTCWECNPRLDGCWWRRTTLRP